MPKRPDTAETVLLALELLRRIPRYRRISAPELHAQLLETEHARDLRTVQRQLDMLSAHFDIERDERSKPYGYRWSDRARGFSMPALTEQESLLLTLAERHLQSLLPASLMKSMESFFDQARSNLSSQTPARREREWISKVRVVSPTQPLLPPVIDPGVFEEVSNALYGNFWLELEYLNASGHIKKSDVMPLGLAQQGVRLYLVCRFQGYQDERTLALHRIRSARASTLTFERPANFDLEKFEAEGQFGFSKKRRVRLHFLVNKEAGFHLLETPLSKDQAVAEHDQNYEITATVVETDQLEWWLRGFGNNLQIIERKIVDDFHE